MTESSGSKRARAGSPLLIAGGALLGALLFAYTLYTAGPAEIFGGIRGIDRSCPPIQIDSIKRVGFSIKTPVDECALC